VTWTTGTLRVAALLGAGALALGGCGSSKKSASSASTTPQGAAPTTSTSSPAAPAGAVRVSADPNGALRFTQTTLHAKAGTVTIVMTNPSSSGLMHGIAVEGNGVDKDGKVVAAGGSSTLRVALKPGRYTFYCNFGQHKQAGMKGTLVVS
jgi:plastocyanin